MYISDIQIENFRCFGEGDDKFVMSLTPGLTALVGENDTGKTAILDALRFVFGTRDQEYFRLDPSDFYCPGAAEHRRNEIRICCCLKGLTTREKGAFAEYLTFLDEASPDDAALYVHWTARDKGGTQARRRSIFTDTRTGLNGEGPVLDAEARDMLRATYLRPLRDAERALSAGRGSRLSEILRHTREIRESGADYDAENDPDPVDTSALSVLGVGDYANKLLRDREGIRRAKEKLNENYLKPLSFAGDDLKGDIDVGASGDRDMRLRKLLERLELTLGSAEPHQPSPNRGLGSNNLLFMACELLLLGSERDELPLLLIEEPEAHLHPQRQLRLMQFLENQARGEYESENRPIQIILTTHSPNLASAIQLDNLVLVHGAHGYPLSRDKTNLSESDYKFLERFLDVTKANLFFARGVLIVEGDAENILIPALAKLTGRDFGANGVSVVNVGGTGLRRFARIYQRRSPETEGEIRVPVACMADLDVMPDCAPASLGLVGEQEELPSRASRRWRCVSDYDAGGLERRRSEIRDKASGQRVETFVSDQWTLEYDLAYAGLANEVWIAACLARSDDQINAGTADRDDVVKNACEEFQGLQQRCETQQELAASVYALFVKGRGASKAIAAQYLAERLESEVSKGHLDAEVLSARLPEYIRAAIDYITGPSSLRDDDSYASSPQAHTGTSSDD